MNIIKAPYCKQVKRITPLMLALLMTGCAATEPTLENDCSSQGVQESIDEANALGALSLVNALAGGDSFRSLSAHARTSEQQAEIIKIKAQLCEQQKAQKDLD